MTEDPTRPPNPIKLMNEQDSSASSENRLDQTESSLTPRGLSPGTSGVRTGGNRQSRLSTTEPRRLEIVLRVEPVVPGAQDRGQTTEDGRQLSPQRRSSGDEGV